MKEEKRCGTARRGVYLLCVAALCIGATVATWAVGEVPQTEVYDALANTAYSSGYMNRGSYSGSVNAVGYFEAANVVFGAGSSDVGACASSAFTLFGRYAGHSAARPLDARPYVGCSIIIR